MNKGETNEHRIKLKENMILCLTEKGGHHSYLEGMWPVKYNYLDKLMADYLEALLILNGHISKSS